MDNTNQSFTEGIYALMAENGYLIVYPQGANVYSTISDEETEAKPPAKGVKYLIFFTHKDRISNSLCSGFDITFSYKVMKSGARAKFEFITGVKSKMLGDINTLLAKHKLTS